MIRNRGNVVAKNNYIPYDRNGNATPNLYIVNYISTTKCNFKHTYPRYMENSDVYKPWIQFTLINKKYIADTTELCKLLTM
jgi:hypothetical protein